jgi:AcrR family transcriptional regulator
MTRKRSAGGASAANERRVSAPRHAHHSLASNNSQPTVDRILDGARRVLVRYGYAGFTTRRVAEAASIAPGNLSYHFPSKRELVRALIQQLVRDYSNQYKTILSDPNIPLGQDVASLVRWLLTDSVAEESAYILRELWTMSLRDAEICRAVDDLYDELMNHIVQLLHRSRPRADVQQIREFVHVLGVMSEGGNVLYGTRMRRAVPYERIIAIATELQKMVAPDLLPEIAVARKRSPARAG